MEGRSPAAMEIAWEIAREIAREIAWDISWTIARRSPGRRSPGILQGRSHGISRAHRVSGHIAGEVDIEGVDAIANPRVAIPAAVGGDQHLARAAAHR